MKFGIFDFFSIIVVAGALQGLLLCLFFAFSKSRNQFANNILGLNIFIVSIILLVGEIVQYYYDIFPHLIAVTFPIMFLLGPLILFYSFSRTGQITGIKGKNWLHFLPALIILLLSIPYFLQSGEVKIIGYKKMLNEGYSSGLFLSWTIVCFHIGIYMVLTFLNLVKHERKLKGVFSNVEKINSKWLREITFLNSIIWGFYLVLLIICLNGYLTDYHNYLYFTFKFLLAVLVYFIGYKGIRQPVVFQLNQIQFEEEIKQEKYLKTKLHPKVADEYMMKLQNHMEEHKPFLRNNLTLRELSDDLNFHPNYLSQVINERFGLNFYDFINKFRIKEAKLLLSTETDFTIIEVAYKVGFNTKSTFNKAFKKYTQLTPTAYRNLQCEGNFESISSKIA